MLPHAKTEDTLKSSDDFFSLFSLLRYLSLFKKGGRKRIFVCFKENKCTYTDKVLVVVENLSYSR